jgi:hypothetical protein
MKEPPDEGGARANFNGRNAQQMIATLLRHAGYQYSTMHTLEGLKNTPTTMWGMGQQFTSECYVPLIAPYHQGRDRKARVDFVVQKPSEDLVLVSVKSQDSNGSAEQKLEYEIQQLVATELPAAMIVLGPVRGRDAKTGWNHDVLCEIWERAKYYGASRVLLFRSVGKLEKWIKEGLPTGGRGVTPAAIFAQYCDREP